MISRVLRLDNGDTRARSDKPAPIRDVWDRWVQLLPLMFNPGPEVTVDGKCPSRRYIPSKPGMYGIKIIGQPVVQKAAMPGIYGFTQAKL